tara:strand:+ start:2062 stop:3201 length:1140 start_codon:yes stop_codon:yes gene_type:complete
MSLGGLAVLLAGFAPAAFAGGTVEFGEHQSITVGAGMRSAFTIVEDSAPSGSDSSTDIDLQSVRVYVNGQIHKNVKFTFNTECESCVFGQDADDIGVLDAILQLELNDAFNIWIGRMLTPADRIELNGPYYALSWNQYTVPLLPSDQLGAAGLLGRDEGVTVWGSIGKLQYAAGIFDGLEGGANQKDKLLFAGRVAYNFLEMEKNPGYYTSSTYYGNGGDVFTLGVSFQSQSDGTGTVQEPGDFQAVIVDALFEKVLGDAGVLTLEGEYKMFDADLTATALADPTCFCLFDGDAFFVTGAYMFPQEVGPGKLQPYVRFTSNEPDFPGMEDSDLTEVGVNYIIKGHNLRFNLNYTSGDANLTGSPGADLDGVSFGVQIQI